MQNSCNNCTGIFWCMACIEWTITTGTTIFNACKWPHEPRKININVCCLHRFTRAHGSSDIWLPEGWSFWLLSSHELIGFQLQEAIRRSLPLLLACTCRAATAEKLAPFRSAPPASQLPEPWGAIHRRPCFYCFCLWGSSWPRSPAAADQVWSRTLRPRRGSTAVLRCGQRAPRRGRRPVSAAAATSARGRRGRCKVNPRG